MSSFLNYFIPLGTLKVNQSLSIEGSEEDLDLLTKRFSVGTFEDIIFSCKCKSIKETSLDLEVSIKTHVKLSCSISNEEFLHTLDETIILRFTSESLKNKEDDITSFPPVYWEEISTMNDKINFSEICIQYLSLLLPDTPKSPNLTEEKEEKPLTKKNPFEVLKILKNQ